MRSQSQVQGTGTSTYLSEDTIQSITPGNPARTPEFLHQTVIFVSTLIQYANPLRRLLCNSEDIINFKKSLKKCLVNLFLTAMYPFQEQKVLFCGEKKISSTLAFFLSLDQTGQVPQFRRVFMCLWELKLGIMELKFLFSV